MSRNLKRNSEERLRGNPKNSDIHGLQWRSHRDHPSQTLCAVPQTTALVGRSVGCHRTGVRARYGCGFLVQDGLRQYAALNALLAAIILIRTSHVALEPYPSRMARIVTF